jgi:hypothetical protein
MTTKPPSPVEPPAEGTTEKLAYESVAPVPTVEPNDGSRLGYHVWRWLRSREGTLEEAVMESGARMTVPVAAAVGLIREQLRARGVTGV